MRPTDQIRSVDPGASYTSSVVNKLISFLTKHKSRLGDTDDLVVSMGGVATKVYVSKGFVTMSDVTIEFPSAMEIDLTLPANYAQPDAGANTCMPAGGGTAYLVVDYQYVNSASPGAAEIKVLKSPSYFSEGRHLFLAALTFDSATSITNIVASHDYYNSSTGVTETRMRQTMNFHDPYTDARAILAHKGSGILDHRDEPSSPWTMPVFAANGVLQLAPLGGLGGNELLVDINGGNTVASRYKWDYSAKDGDGSVWMITIHHCAGRMVNVQTYVPTGAAGEYEKVDPSAIRQSNSTETGFNRCLEIEFPADDLEHVLVVWG